MDQQGQDDTNDQGLPTLGFDPVKAIYQRHHVHAFLLTLENKPLQDILYQYLNQK
jgi:hypothetical protein